MEKLSQQEYYITLTDYLINKVPANGTFNAYQQMMGCNVDANNYTVGPDIKEKAHNNNYDFVIYYAEKENGFIIHPKDNRNTEIYILTELGREVKSRGGFHNWENFKKGVESVPFENIRWMKETAEATREAADAAKTSANFAEKTFILIAVYTFLTACLVFIGLLTCNYQRNQKSHTNVPNSNRETTVSRLTDINK